MTTSPLDVALIRKDFPILQRTMNGNRLSYLDSGSSSQKPQMVLDAMDEYYEFHHANVHRGAYTLAAEADAAYEGARADVARFVGANDAAEIIFTKNATESINLVAQTWAQQNIGRGDAILLSELEHHSNIVPWQMLRERVGCEIRVIPITSDGLLDLTNLDKLLDGVKLLSITAMSNVTGTRPPIQLLTKRAHDAGALVLLDACQSVPHEASNFAALDVDFAVFSAHKMCGPTGIGVLYGKRALLDAMPAFLGGGSMIRDVRLAGLDNDGFDTAEVPQKFEAGTPPIAEAVGLGAAVRYLEAIGINRILEHEMQLTQKLLVALDAAFDKQIQIFGSLDLTQRGGVVSFSFENVHPHDLSQVLDDNGVCVRAGHHCAKPLMRRLGVSSTARASLYLYNDVDDIEALVDGLAKASKIFG